MKKLMNIFMKDIFKMINFQVKVKKYIQMVKYMKVNLEII